MIYTNPNISRTLTANEEKYKIEVYKNRIKLRAYLTKHYKKVYGKYNIRFERLGYPRLGYPF